jgi:hypothetical protein
MPTTMSNVMDLDPERQRGRDEERRLGLAVDHHPP